MGGMSSLRLAEVRARTALRDAGLPHDVDLERVPGTTNEVWLTTDHVVKVSISLEGRLSRESRLMSHVPQVAVAGPVVAVGSVSGQDWMITERSPGSVLSDQWSQLTTAERRRAVHQLGEVLRALHRAPAPEVESVPPGTPHPVMGSDPTAPLLEIVERLRSVPHVAGGLLTDVEATIRESAHLLVPWDEATLIHGDAHFENVMWDGEITGLIDFEWARAAPPDLELDVFLRFTADPHLHVNSTSRERLSVADYEQVPSWLAEVYPELFDTPKERLRVFALAYDLRSLLAQPPTGMGRRLHPQHPLNRVARTLVFGGHLRFLV